MFLPRIRAQKSVTRRLLSLWAVALLVPVFGCKDSVTNRFDVAGMVTFEGKPVPAGMIYFSPDQTKKNDGPQGFAEIHDGRYETRKTGRGGPGGPVQVRIEGFDGERGQDQPFGQALFFHEVDIVLPRASTTKDFNVPASAAKNVPKRKGPPI